MNYREGTWPSTAMMRHLNGANAVAVQRGNALVGAGHRRRLGHGQREGASLRKDREVEEPNDME